MMTKSILRFLFLILLSLPTALSVWAQGFSATSWISLRGYTGGVKSVSVSDNGKYVALRPDGLAKSVEVFDANYQKIFMHVSKVPANVGEVVFSPDNQYLFFTNYEKPSDIAILNLQTKRIVRVLKKHTAAVTHLAISANGKYLVSSGKDKFLRIWEYDGRRFFEIQSFRSNSGNIHDLAISDNGQVIAAANANQTITTMQLNGKQFSLEQTLRVRAPVKTLDLNSKGDWLVAGFSTGEMNVFAAVGGEYQNQFAENALSTEIKTINFAPADDYLAVAGVGKVIKIYNIKRGAPMLDKYLLEHDNTINDLAFSADGKWMISGSNDGHAKVWKLQGAGKRPAITELRDARPVKPSGLPPILAIEEITFSESTLDAGETAQLQITLKNNGPGDAEQVEVQLNSEQAGILLPNDLKFPRIAKNGGRETKVFAIKGAPQLMDGQANLRINIVESAFGIRLQGRQVSFQTKQSPKPSLKLAKFAVLEHASASPNNQIDLNEMIDVKFVVQNLGYGPARNVAIKVNNQQNGVLFLGVDQGGNLVRQEPTIDMIPSGGYATLIYRYFVNSEFGENHLKFGLVANEAMEQYGFNEQKLVEINKDLKEEGEIVVMEGNNPNYRPGQVQDIPNLRIDVRENIPETNRVNRDAVAVVIGNRDYRNRDVPSVDFAIEDARVMKQYLVKTFGFRPGNILFYENATQADFNAVFGSQTNPKGKLFNYVKPDVSDVFIYYSGHGAPDPESKEGFFVPVDCEPSLVSLNGYGLNTFYNNLANVPFRSLTVVIDACFSGSSDGGMLLKNISPVFIQPKSRVINDERAMVFTSAGGDQVSSWYPEKRHSLFTYFFLKGLQGEANPNCDNDITLKEMQQYIDSQVPYMARRLNNRVQEPEIYGLPNMVLTGF